MKKLPCLFGIHKYTKNIPLLTYPPSGVTATCHLKQCECGKVKGSIIYVDTSKADTLGISTSWIHLRGSTENNLFHTPVWKTVMKDQFTK